MSFNPLTRSLALGALATVVFACSNDNSGNVAGTGGNPSDGGGGTSTGGTAGKGGTSGSGGASGSGGSSKEAGTSCGDTLVLGDYWKQTPAKCTTCVQTNCCAESQACSSDTGCTDYRKCLAACDQYDPVCQNACAPPADSDAGAHSSKANGDFNLCRITKCQTDCDDLSCVGKAWPAPTTAHDITVDATVTNFAGGAPMAGVTIKVCAPTDTNCATPLDQGTTKSDGTIQLKVPAAAGGTDAYLELSGADVFPQLSYIHLAGGDGPFARTGLGALDPKTAAAFEKLAGGMAFPDGGSADAGFPYGSVAVLPRSCANSLIAGATVSSSAAGSAAVTSYLVNGIPSTTAKATDSTGIGAIVNHAPGQTTVTVKLGTQTLGTASVIVRAGALTTVTVLTGK